MLSAIEPRSPSERALKAARRHAPAASMASAMLEPLRTLANGNKHDPRIPLASDNLLAHSERPARPGARSLEVGPAACGDIAVLGRLGR